MGTTSHFIQDTYKLISDKTGSINVIKGSVDLTIQASQPNTDAPVMATLYSGDNHPIKVKSGYQLYAIKSTSLETEITYTEA